MIWWFLPLCHIISYVLWLYIQNNHYPKDNTSHRHTWSATSPPPPPSTPTSKNPINACTFELDRFSHVPNPSKSSHRKMSDQQRTFSSCCCTPGNQRETLTRHWNGMDQWPFQMHQELDIDHSRLTTVQGHQIEFVQQPWLHHLTPMHYSNQVKLCISEEVTKSEDARKGGCSSSPPGGTRAVSPVQPILVAKKDQGR